MKFVYYYDLFFAVSEPHHRSMRRQLFSKLLICSLSVCLSIYMHINRVCFLSSLFQYPTCASPNNPVRCFAYMVTKTRSAHHTKNGTTSIFVVSAVVFMSFPDLSVSDAALFYPRPLHTLASLYFPFSCSHSVNLHRRHVSILSPRRQPL